MVKIDDTFIEYASEILGDTTSGLSGTQIVKYCNKYAIEFGVKIPIGTTDFGKFGSKVPNKRTALRKNLSEFNAIQQFHIIKELCKLPIFNKNIQVNDLKKKLFIRYATLAKSSNEISGVQMIPLNIKSQSIDNKKGFIENYIHKLEVLVDEIKGLEGVDEIFIEDKLFELIMEIRNIFFNELPQIDQAILLRSGTGLRDANSVIGILRLYVINLTDNAQEIEKEKTMKNQILTIKFL